jgi:glycerol-3-phosphate O-acyltransferase
MCHMTEATQRRTDAYRLRQTISQLLDQLYAVEYSMQVYDRKRDREELDRAAESYDSMLVHVDRLGELLRAARYRQSAGLVAEPTD